MEWHEDLSNLASQAGLKGKKLNKVKFSKVNTCGTNGYKFLSDACTHPSDVLHEGT